jgi:hypothetical protein
MKILPVLLAFLTTSASAEMLQMPSECTYEMQVWNVKARGSTDQKKIRHPYADLKAEEIDPKTGCTVCLEDQVRIDIPQLPPIYVCNKIASKVRFAINSTTRAGFPVYAMVGYHVIKSRGALDENGNRTDFSNHSFGTAIDINPEQNGLYDNCNEFGPQCRLLRGGEWHLGSPGTLDKNSRVVSEFKKAGFQWGGEIAGKQKDFMHFSLTGY